VWTFGGFHAVDRTDPNSPMIVHRFVPRSTPAVRLSRGGTRWGRPSTAWICESCEQKSACSAHSCCESRRSTSVPHT
jgi:hypothetical protein